MPRDALANLGEESGRIYVDHSFASTNKNHAGLHEAVGACGERDALVATKLDRLARSVRDAHEIADGLARREIGFSVGGSGHNPTNPMGKSLFIVLEMISEFEAGVIPRLTREDMKVATAKTKDRLRGKQPKLTVKHENHLLELHACGPPN